MGSLFLDREEHLDYPAAEIIVNWSNTGSDENLDLDVVLVGRNGTLPEDGEFLYPVLQAGIQGFLTAVRAADVSTAFGSTYDPPLTVFSWSVTNLDESMTDASANYS